MNQDNTRAINQIIVRPARHMSRRTLVDIPQNYVMDLVIPGTSDDAKDPSDNM